MRLWKSSGWRMIDADVTDTDGRKGMMEPCARPTTTTWTLLTS